MGEGLERKGEGEGAGGGRMSAMRRYTQRGEGVGQNYNGVATGFWARPSNVSTR